MKNWVDYLIVLALLISLLRGYKAGLFATLFRAIGYIGGGFLGLVGAIHFVSSWNGSLQKFLAALAAIFIGASIGESIFGKIGKGLHGKVLFAPFKWLDSLLGAALSIARTLILLFVLGHLSLAMPWSWAQHDIKGSALFTKLDKVAPNYWINLRSLPSQALLK